jgi:hypothetical protein
MTAVHHFLAATLSGLLLYLPTGLPAQVTFSRTSDIEVKQQGKTLQNPWTGGLNAPQVSAVDLNHNDTTDLFIFDRNRKKIVPYINKSTPTDIQLEHAPHYADSFPDLNHWGLFYDYNCDGNKDLWAGTGNNRIAVYRNSSSKDLTFDQVTTALEADSSPIYVSKWDIPAITDVDDDGDLDLLTFDQQGSFLLWYQNLSQEKYGHCDSLIFTLASNCWGNFKEAFASCDIDTNISCLLEGSSTGNSRKHAGSTILSLDNDNDGDKDLVIGDLGCTYVYQLTNTGTATSSPMSDQNTNYPADQPIDLERFPATFYTDINHDGVKDLLAAPNGVNNINNMASLWFFQNAGKTTNPNFVFANDTFLQNEMIEVGEGAHPVFFDYNDDSLPDLLIGNYGYFKSSGNFKGTLTLYENTGTLQQPSFKLVSRNYSGLASLNLTDIYPTLGDLNDDGKKELIIGESDGKLHYFTDNSGDGQPAQFNLTEVNFAGIDVGQSSTPQLVDVNEDGLLDLLIGERSGTLNYYKNNGTADNPSFSLVTESFGEVDVKAPGEVTGYSVPFLTRQLDSTGATHLLVGSERGTIYHYTDIDDNLDAVFTLQDSSYRGIHEGARTTVTVENLNGDTLPDLLVGNEGGGVALYTGQSGHVPPDTTADTTTVPFKVNLFPNPTREKLYININGAPQANAHIVITNILGEQVYTTTYEGLSKKATRTITIENFPAGIYFCHVAVNEHTIMRRLVFL